MNKIIPFLLLIFFQLDLWAQNQPKLVIYLVFDQMRADYLLKYESEFKKTKSKDLGGFRYLRENGAYFPYAQYDVLQNMTCPGHAMISSGSWPINTGISQNEWYSRESGKMTYCSDDDKFGLSPNHLKTTTVSDEFKSLDKPSKVIGIALKDRSAIMLAGHRADAVYWFNEKNWNWETSSYYKALPEWVKKYNENISPQKGDKNLLMTKWGVEATVNLAIEAIKQEKLGQTKGTDFLFISFSTHDIAGHVYGPNSSEMKALTLAEDKEISRFLNAVNEKLNLAEQVQIVLTADHGIPSTVEYSQSNKLKADYIKEIEMIEKLYSFLNKKYALKGKQEWFSGIRMFHYFVNFKVLEENKIDRKEFLETVREFILKQDQAEEVLITSQFPQVLPLNPQIRSQVQNSFVQEQWGDIVLIPKPYFMNATTVVKVNHITGYTYDRTVPLIFYGKKFKKGTYYQKAFIVDIASTIAATLGSLPGAKADGRVLHECLK